MTHDAMVYDTEGGYETNAICNESNSKGGLKARKAAKTMSADMRDTGERYNAWDVKRKTRMTLAEWLNAHVEKQTKTRENLRMPGSNTTKDPWEWPLMEKQAFLYKFHYCKAEDRRRPGHPFSVGKCGDADF